MITKILFIGLLFQATTFQASKSADENSKKQDNSCVRSQVLVSIHFIRKTDKLFHEKSFTNQQCRNRNNICCDPNEKCEYVGWRLGKADYVCKIPKKLGGNCTSDSDCSAIIYAFCNYKNECQCSSYFIKKNDYECELPMDIPCMTSVDCPIKNSVCSSERCVCKPNFVRRNDECEQGKLNLAQNFQFIVLYTGKINFFENLC